MSYFVLWRNEARQSLSRLRTADPVGAKRVTAAVRELASDPRPATSSPLGSTAFRRLKLDDLRITYLLDDVDEVVEILLVGSLPRGRPGR